MSPHRAGSQRVGATASGGPGGVDLLLMWHMHQPDYRDQDSGDFNMPWVYLHALKDYSDMAWHLEHNPGVRAVVNFVPVLLEQLEDYDEQFSTQKLRDPLLRLLAHSEDQPLSDAERRYAFDQCFRANHHRLIAPFAPYKKLYDIFSAIDAQSSDGLLYLSERYVYDLVTWYHLSWTGESVRRESEPVARLMAQGAHFSLADRAALLRVVASTVQSIVPRYRALAAHGRIEITTTPQCHPLAPLLLDFRSARDTQAEVALPAYDHYPGGEERVCAHLDAALESHARRFGTKPLGLWPAEGALSARFAALLASRGLGWTASSQGVLSNSLRASGASGDVQNGTAMAHRPYRASSVAPGLLFFFRDDRLSDLIGFTYSQWHGNDAAQHFLHELAAIAARAPTGPRPVVSVILDGENAWEYYPYNGYFFLSDLYRSLSTSPVVRMITGSDMLKLLAAPAAGTAPPALGELTSLAAGSWVYGNLATWIGAQAKNRAWDLLCAAKECLDTALASGRVDSATRAQALRQLADCEASDWFWWPGEDNPGETVRAFEALFRRKLASLYRTIGVPIPEALTVVLSTGAQPGAAHAELGGTMRRGT